MQTLSNVPFNELRVGDRVKSKYTSNEGFISALYPKKINSPLSPFYPFIEDEIQIKWDDENITIYYHYCFASIWLM